MRAVAREKASKDLRWPDFFRIRDAGGTGTGRLTSPPPAPALRGVMIGRGRDISAWLEPPGAARWARLAASRTGAAGILLAAARRRSARIVGNSDALINTDGHDYIDGRHRYAR